MKKPFRSNKNTSFARVGLGLTFGVIAPLNTPCRTCFVALGTQDNEGNLGGAIYNEGKMTMFQFADFYYNTAAVSGHAWRKTISTMFQRDVRVGTPLNSGL